jgi:hypothetical protein
LLAPDPRMKSSADDTHRAPAHRWAWAVSALIFAGLVGLVAANFHYARQATRSTAGREEVLDAKDPEVRRLSAEVAALEKTWQDATAGGTIPGPAALDALDQALQKQRALNRLTAGQNEEQTRRLRRLETARADLRAPDTLAHIARLQDEGQVALDANRPDEAVAPLREALRLQRELNAATVSANFKSNVREAALRQAVAAAEAAPLARELDAALAQARAAAAAGRAAEALAAFRRANALQARINRDHPGTARADRAAEQRLAAEMDSVGAAGLREESEAAERTAETALAAGRASEAAVAFQQARADQLEINEKYARSPLVSLARAEALEERRQAAASLPGAERLAALDREITALLRKREPAPAADKIAEARREAERLAATFPKSPHLDANLREKLRHLDARRAELAEIQRQVFGHLRPLPGAPGLTLLDTETPQTLYALVTGTNPSRHAGPGLPADSVSWRDAHTFCERLSWMLGTTARLPTEAEFRAALGPGEPPAAWSRDSSGGATQPAGKQPANAAGFSELLGNVAEWLAAEAATDRASVIGGSYLDPAAAVRRVPVEPREKTDRARHIGFRFVVELPAAGSAGP